MTDDDRLQQLLRAAYPRAIDPRPSRDLWPMIVRRIHTPAALSWLDLGMASAVGILLILFPDWLLFLAYHL